MDKPGHRLTLWWSEYPGAAEVEGRGGDDIWRCSCGWRDDEDYSTAPGPAKRGLAHAVGMGGTIAFRDPATGWRGWRGWRDIVDDSTEPPEHLTSRVTD